MAKDTDNNDLDALFVHKATPEYLQELLRDKKQLQNFPNIFLHLEIILEKEIARVREKLFHLNESIKKTENDLPEPSGVVITLQEKVFVPIKENPNYNFVGRLLGPRGLTAKQLEQDLECKIMVRGKGSLRDKKKEDMNRGKPNWEHLDEELHVLVSVEDYENRAAIKLHRATETIRQFLEQGVKTPENEDRLKQLQLMELAVLNDKDRQQAQVQQIQQHQQQQQQQHLILQQQSMAVLNNQAAMAAAAQLFHSASSIPTNQLLLRLQNQTTTLGHAGIQLNPTAVSLSGASSNSSLPLSTGNALTSYLSSPALSNVLGGVGGTTASSVPSGSVGLGLSLSQLQSTATGLGISNLPFPALQSSVQSSLMGFNPNSDQLSAVAAALFAGGGNSTTASNNIQLGGVKVNLPTLVTSKPSTSFYPMTSLPSQLMDSVNIMDYTAAASNFGQEQSSESLKVRSLHSSSGQSRMHPYLR